MNNIEQLSSDIKEREKANQELAGETFTQPELTEEEKEKLQEMSRETQTVVSETTPSGGKVSTPISEYAAPLDKRIMEIEDPMTGATEIMKAVNKGDITKSVDVAKEEARLAALNAFRSLSRKKDEYSDTDYLRINDAALASIKQYYHLDRLDSEVIINKLKKLSIQDIIDILPDEFVEIYVDPADLTRNTYRAKEKLLTAIGYITVTGPEMDYLNEYIDNEHRMMEVTHRLMQCQVDLTDMIQSKETMSEIAKKATEFCPPDTSVWAKYINGGNTKLVHNKFAQLAVICDEYRKAYEKVLEDYKDNERAVKMIQDEIDESIAKKQIYLDVTNLELFKELWEIMVTRYANDKRTTYAYLEKEAIAAVDRCRRSKLNIPFPAYQADAAKNPKAMYAIYMEQYPEALRAYNSTLLSVKNKHTDTEDGPEVQLVQINGVPEDTVYHYFSMLLVIVFGRIMKRCTDRDATKFNMILADAYFQCFCEMCGDLYLLTEVWTICKPFVEHAIKTWPRPAKRR